jgi:serine/threonine-protein kinase
MSDLIERLDRALGDQYRVTGELGRGGMAVVYSADDVKHGRPVAIKVMKPEIAHDLGTERFLREIETVARLSHPNILSLHDSGTVDGLLYFVMPYVDGDTLRSRLDRTGPLALEEAIRITAEVADALSFAHARGLIHRDIKPENILFQAGHAVVSDFGIAKAVTDAGGTLTKPGLALGTLRYMSPEQAAGDADVDAHSDIYSLACVLYEMLTGEAPFAGVSSQALLVRKVTGPPPLISEARSDIPATVEGVVATALATAPGERFDTPTQFTEALARAATAEAIAEEAHRRQRTKRMRLAVGAPAVALVGAVVWWGATLLGGPAIERVAVLPLTNAMNDPSQDFFVEGVHVDLIKELSRAGVGVITPTSVLQYRDSDQPVSEIARELGVDAVIEGSASLVGGNISLDLRMTDGVTDEIVWFDAFQAEVRDVLSIYGAVTLAIADAAGIEMSPESETALAGTPQVSPEVQEALWQARFHQTRLSEESLSQALDYYQLALSRDPDNAVAFAGISGVWGSRAQFGFVSGEEATAEAAEALARAIEIDSTLAEVQHRLASTRTWREWDWAAAEPTFRRALDADPMNSRARSSFSHLLQYLGHDEEAATQIELAVQQDPLNPRITTFYAMGLNYRHEYETALDVVNEALSRSPDYGMALTTRRTTYHMMGRYEEALDVWRASSAQDPEKLEALERGYEEGGYSGALRGMAEVLVARSDTTFVTPWQIGTLYTRAGDTELALDYLELAYEAHDGNIPYLSVDPIFDDLRDEARFRRIIERLGLPN